MSALCANYSCHAPLALKIVQNHSTTPRNSPEFSSTLLLVYSSFTVLSNHELAQVHIPRIGSSSLSTPLGPPQTHNLLKLSISLSADAVVCSRLLSSIHLLPCTEPVQQKGYCRFDAIPYNLSIVLVHHTSGRRGIRLPKGRYGFLCRQPLPIYVLILSRSDP